MFLLGILNTRVRAVCAGTAIMPTTSHCCFLRRSGLVIAMFVVMCSDTSTRAQAPETVTSSEPSSAVASPNSFSAFPDSSSAIDRASRFGPGQAALTGSGTRQDSVRPGYKLLRYNEDYRFLRDPGQRTDPWDSLKYIPFGAGDDSFLTLGGEVREWFETYHNSQFGAGPANTAGYNALFHQRYMLHADLHLNETFRIFAQTINGFEDGGIGGPRPDVDVNRFDLHQGFFDSVWELEDDARVTWRLGRQEFNYGSGRLIDVREGPNLRRSFDAGRVLTKLGDWSIDAWWGKPVRNNAGVFDDDPSPQVSFWGAYAVHPIGDGSTANVDLYYIGYNNDQARFNQKSGHEVRHSIGARLWGRPLPWEYNLEYIYQFGEFGSGQITAWSAANAVRYHFDDLWLKPHPGIRFDIASGDPSATSNNLGTFNPMFPSGAYFNLAGPFGPLNIIDLHPTLDLQLTDKLTLTADWNFFWRENTADGVYALSGQLIAPGTSGQARFIGSSPSLTWVWSPLPHWTVLASYVHVFPGEFLKQATLGKPIDYVACWLTYKF